MAGSGQTGAVRGVRQDEVRSGDGWLAVVDDCWESWHRGESVYFDSKSERDSERGDGIAIITV
jgi:hypothetical protein